MPEIVSFNPGSGIITVVALPGEDLTGWTFEGYQRSGNTASFTNSGPLDLSNPQVSASDPSLIYYTSNFGLPTLNQRDAVALVDDSGNVEDVVGFGNDNNFLLVGGSAGGVQISTGNANFAGDNDNNWYSRDPGDPWNGNNGSPDNGLPNDLGPYSPPCLVAGTLIDTPDGLRAVEALKPGDLVCTADQGARPLLWSERGSFAAMGKFAPVLICKGALGNARDLRVSQQHRMLLANWQTELATGYSEVLVAAKHLVNGRDIVIEEGGRVDYVHLLFDRHQIIFAEGAATESYLPAHAVGKAEMGVNREALALFPDLVARSAELARTARPVAKRFEVAAMVA